MATTTATRAEPATGEQCVELGGIGWRGYSTMLRLRGESPTPRMIYLDGDLLLMSPSQPHEWLKKRLGTFVSEVVTGLGIPHIPTGQMTFRARGRRGGIEGDETYYLANAARVRGRRIDLRTDPPPDLAIEATHTHPVTKALATYRRLRVPEVWVGSTEGVRILRLQPDGRYAESPTSASFPFLKAAEIDDWLRRPDTGDETEWTLAVRQWVRDALAPRLRDPGPREPQPGAR